MVLLQGEMFKFGNTYEDIPECRKLGPPPKRGIPG